VLTVGLLEMVVKLHMGRFYNGIIKAESKKTVTKTRSKTAVP